MRRLLPFAFAFALVMPSLRAETLRLCYDTAEKSGSQLGSFAVLEQLSRNTGVQFEYVERVWNRCWAGLMRGLWDGVVAASYRADRARLAAYPMWQGLPDPERRLRQDGYSLFRLRGSTVSWDGEHFAGIDGMVGAQTGYSIVNWLREHGLQVDASTTRGDQCLRKLAAGRIDAVALLSDDGARLLRQHPDYAAVIEQVQPPLFERAYYLVFSLKRYRADPQRFEQLWNALPAARATAEVPSP